MATVGLLGFAALVKEDKPPQSRGGLVTRVLGLVTSPSLRPPLRFFLRLKSVKYVVHERLQEQLVELVCPFHTSYRRHVLTLCNTTILTIPPQLTTCHRQL